jgi:hypothetical protein
MVAEGDKTVNSIYESQASETTSKSDASQNSEVQSTSSSNHSNLHLPNYSTQQIIDYFEEVVLHMEYADGNGNTSLVQKWNAPIRYRIYGDYTKTDLEVLTNLFAQLNEVKGFPGIYAATQGEQENLTIDFFDHETFSAVFSTILNGEDAYGATQFWYYTDTNEIHTASVGYRTDIDQTIRTSILIEEIINMLGISDTVLREDSIVYQYSNDNMALSDVDWVIVKLLYEPSICCGSDFDGCSESIRELYY